MKKNIILLVQTEEQAKHLAAAGQVIGKLAPYGLWVLYSPILCVDAAKVALPLRAEIAELDKAEKQAASVGDYESAKKHRANKDAKILNLSVEVRNAWKGVAPDERKKRAGTFLEPFLKAANPENKKNEGWRVTMLPEHQEPEFWIQALNELKGAWHSDMKPGEFMVVWPGQLTVDLEADKKFSEDIKNAFIKAQETFCEDAGLIQPTAEDLSKLPYFTLRAKAKKAGIEITKGMRTPQIVAAILAKVA